MDRPLFSVVTPVYNPPIDALAECIESVLAQTWEDWELILVDDCSPDPEVRETLRRFAAEDTRVKVIERETNGHIVAASNDGIDAATGSFIALLDHDDLLTPDALAANAAMIERFPETDYIYSDEDKVDENGRFYGAFRKPQWSPERLRGQNYCSHLSVLRTDLVREVGGFREGFDGSQDHDLVLRIVEKARRVGHIPKILYHWRAVAGSTAADNAAKPYAAEAGRKAVQEHLDRLQIKARVTVDAPGLYSLHRTLDPQTSVSIIVPTIGSAGLIWGTQRVMPVGMLQSVIEKTRHPNWEIVIVYDKPTPKKVLGELRELGGDRVKLVKFTEKFNYSRKMNVGALHSDGERLLLLNDDMELISEDWMENLIGPLDESDVGMTGGKLFFTNGTIQHAGHTYSRRHYHHPFIFMNGDEEGPFRALLLNREATGVTAAMAGIRREVYFQVGGFTEILPANFNDVDLSYKVRHHGYRIVWVHNSRAYHFESRSRPRVVEGWERELVVRRWGYPVTDVYLPGK